MWKYFLGFVVALGGLIYLAISLPIFQIGMAAVNGLKVIQ